MSVLNEVLLPAMKDVGDRFGAGELILPFVLQSAEVMKRSVSHLEQYLERVEGYSKGTVVVATVFGDVHDIGKSLLVTILSNNGYTVHDLGKQVPANTIIDAAIDKRADAIGLSALLVSTSKQMPLCVQELDARNVRVPVLVGGAAINRSFGRRSGVLPDGRVYEPGVFYCKDVFEGLATLEALVGEDTVDFVQRERAAIEAERDAPRVTPVARATPRPAPPPRQDVPLPSPSSWGPRRVAAELGDELAAAGPQHAVPPSLGRPPRQRRRVRAHRGRRLRARAGASCSATPSAMAGSRRASSAAPFPATRTAISWWSLRPMVRSSPASTSRASRTAIGCAWPTTSDPCTVANGMWWSCRR